MKKGPDDEAQRHSEEQIIAILKEREAGMKTADPGSAMRPSTTGRASAKGLRSPRRGPKGRESENAKLKKLLADAVLDNAALKDLLRP
jgi:putative transposase